MLLIIDNYDSFTYNLVQYFQVLGQDVVVRRNDQISLEEIATLAPTHLVISPGPKTPDAAGISLTAIHHFAGKLPILGVCLGHQCIGQSFGAKVIHAPQVMHGKTSPIYHENQGIFQQLPSPFIATRYHSLILDEATLPDCLEVIAWTKDIVGREVMGIRHRSLPIVGVQFHPESILTVEGHRLLQNFLHYKN